VDAQKAEYSVSVSVLEVRDAPPRRRIGTLAAAAPSVAVKVSCGGTTHLWTAPKRGIDVLFDRTKRQSFPKASGSSSLTITVLDKYSSGMFEQRAQAVLPLADLQLKDPVYVWLPVPRVPRRQVSGVRGAVQRIVHFGSALTESAFSAAQEAAHLPFDPLQQHRGEVLVFMRLHAMPTSHSHAQMSLTVKLMGGGIIVGSGGDEELAAFSFHSLQASLELRESSLTVAGTLHAVQIDDQSLATHQPVVLGPAGIVSKGVFLAFVIQPFMHPIILLSMVFAASLRPGLQV
jgi:hypothetical protein